MAVEVEMPEAQATTGRPNRIRDEYSIAGLFRKLRDECVTLMRQEVQLAKTETAEKAKTAARNSAMLGVGAVVAVAGLLFVLLGVSFIVTALLVKAGVSWLASLWLGPLIVGIATAIVGYVLIRKGMSAFKQESVVPERTIRSLQEDQQWLKQKLS